MAQDIAQGEARILKGTACAAHVQGTHAHGLSRGRGCLQKCSVERASCKYTHVERLCLTWVMVLYMQILSAVDLSGPGDPLEGKSKSQGS